MASSQGFRTVVMYGGKPKFRWSVRTIVLLVLLVCGFLPYAHEIGGYCRVLPVEQRGIRSQVDGEITAVYVEEGKQVAEGEPIVQLLARDEVSAVAQKEAALDAAKAELELLTNGTRPEEVAIAQDQVEQWETQVEFAQLAYQRELKLSKANAGATKKVEDAQRSHEIAKKELEAAREHLDKLQNGSRQEEIDSAEADVRRLAAELAYHKESVALTMLKSPIAGTIVTPNVQERVSQTVEQGDLVAIVHDTSTLRVEVAADEQAAPAVEIGMPVRVRFNGTQGRTITGTVHSIASRAVDSGQFGMERIRSDDESWTEEIIHREDEHHVSVYVALDEHEENLIPGMTGYAKIHVSSGTVFGALWRPLKRFFLVEVWSWLP